MEWHDRTCEEGGEAGKRFLMGQKIPGTCTYNLCTDDLHKTHMWTWGHATYVQTEVHTEECIDIEHR